MLQQKIARLASEFAAQIVGMLTTMPLDDLVDFTSRRGPAKASPPVAPTKATRANAKKRAPSKSVADVAPSRSAPERASTRSAPAASSPSPEATSAALAFFIGRGTRGATAQQLGEHLAELGLAGSTDVVTTLAQSGGIRDAGFRRAAGKNATAPVFVAT